MGNTLKNNTESKTVFSETHKFFSQVYSDATPSPTMTLPDLLKVFPQRTLFCKAFLSWMPRLSYRNTANKESFIFANEILSMEGEEIISTAYKNHSYVFTDILFHVSLCKLPKEITTVTLEDTRLFAEVFANFMFKDDHKLTDLPSKIVDLVVAHTDIASEPVSFQIVTKLTHQEAEELPALHELFRQTKHPPFVEART